MSLLLTEIQKLDPEAILPLYTLDCTAIGGTILAFTPGQANDAPIVFGGVTYTPVDVDFDEIEVSGIGALPQPKLSIASSDPLVHASLNTLGDITGCRFTRIRTFPMFLDGASAADPNAFFGPDVFSIEAKTDDNPDSVTWTLSPSVDMEGRQLPARPMIRSTCMWRYRSWNEGTNSFDYSRSQCPYAGDNFFDDQDNPVTDPSEDRPSRTLNCCRVRFGAGEAWPFGGFPGMGRSL